MTCLLWRDGTPLARKAALRVHYHQYAILAYFSGEKTTFLLCRDIRQEVLDQALPM